MLKTAKLNELKYVCFKEKETFFKAKDEDLTLQFVSDKYELDNALVHFKNGKVIEVYSLKNDNIVIPANSELLQIGRLDVMVSIPSISKTWVLDGIRIKQTESDELLEISAYRDELDTKLTDFENRIKALELDKVPFNF